MIRRLPVLPTLLVLVAVGVMIRLGVWQLERMHEKEALLERSASVQGDATVRDWPAGDIVPLSYSRVRVECLRVLGQSARAGQNALGEPGWAQTARCEVAGGGKAEVVLGWSRHAVGPVWSGGVVTGTYLSRGLNEWSVIADPPLAGLEANARPDPSAIPNNHLSYAVQWFFFAATALVIYGLALRKRLGEG